MKLVFQLAGGIVLGSLILFAIVGSVMQYQLQQELKEIESAQVQRALKNKEIVRQNRLKQLREAKKRAPVSVVRWEKDNYYGTPEQVEERHKIIDDLIDRMD